MIYYTQYSYSPVDKNGTGKLAIYKRNTYMHMYIWNILYTCKGMDIILAYRMQYIRLHALRVCNTYTLKVCNTYLKGIDNILK